MNIFKLFRSGKVSEGTAKTTLEIEIPEQTDEDRKKAFDDAVTYQTDNFRRSQIEDCIIRYVKGDNWEQDREEWLCKITTNIYTSYCSIEDLVNKIASDEIGEENDTQ